MIDVCEVGEKLLSKGVFLVSSAIMNIRKVLSLQPTVRVGVL